MQNLVGEENQGWTYAKFLLNHERTSNAGRRHLQARAAKLKEIAAEQMVERPPAHRGRALPRPHRAGRDGTDGARDHQSAGAVAFAREDQRALGPEVSVLKIKGSEIIQQLAELKMHALGHDALPYVREALDMDWVRQSAAGDALPLYAPPLSGQYFNQRKTTIYAGSTEIQKNIISQMILGFEEEHLWNSITAKSNWRYRTRCSASFHATTISTSGAASPRSALGYSAEAWAQYAELGLLALPFPEEFGGLGGNGVDIMVVMEQFGQGLLLEPFLSTVVTCGGLLRDAASAAAEARSSCRKIAAGKLKLSLAAYEAAGRYDLSYVACTAPEERRLALTGRKTVVLDGAPPTIFWCRRAAAGRPASRGYLAVSRAARGGRVSPSLPTRRNPARAPPTCYWRSVGSAPRPLIGDRGAPWAVERGVDRAIAALCAEAVGIVNALNQATLDYLKTRKQFGVAIGMFQALKHHMADMLSPRSNPLHGHHRRGSCSTRRMRRAAPRGIRRQSLYRAARRVSSVSMPCRCTAAWAWWTTSS